MAGAEILSHRSLTVSVILGIMIVTRGNAHRDGAAFGHWFVGDFAGWGHAQDAASFGLRQSSDVEIKWGLHPTGEERAEWAPCSDRITLSLLVRGRFVVKFRSPSARNEVTEVRLEREGDYALWAHDVEHTWLVEDEAVILTVRWRTAEAGNAAVPAAET